MNMETSVRIPITEQEFNDDIIFSTFNIRCCNPCLALYAFSNSVKARDSRLRGDFTAAKAYGDKARRLNIGAFLLGLISLIAFVVVIFQSVNQPRDVNEPNRYQY
ncbi:hypothetical protein IRJ41_016658 [Triplophysa rosa]|uniref:Uncharacterized protein n=1 Tax=Triplophysa rosa TaxID=992332 RepID=A0A9W8CAS5_TRIRA|nr:hypothetical protein IRJ41_016658 [Triplophysa rosa]